MSAEATSSESEPSSPAPTQDVVAAFHTSFHYTQGNTLDWSASVDDAVYEPILKGVEFSSLPSGLHTVEQDVIYFTKSDHDAVAVFWRRKEEDEGRRGYQMEAYGVLLAPSAYPRPWRHINALKKIQNRESLEQYFQTTRVPAAAPLPQDDEVTPPNWESEFLTSSSHPMVHFPHLLRIIGPSFLTIFKYVLSRRRVLLYTRAPVEPACMLAKACIDAAFPGFSSTITNDDEDGSSIRRDDRRPLVLGVVGLSDLDLLKTASTSGLGWVACTTDAIFLERPALYDLILDLTTAAVAQSPGTLIRPTLSASRTVPTSSTTSTQKLSQVRFTFSDVRLWTKVDKVLRECGHPEHHAHQPGKGSEKRWADFLPWRLYSYEDACIICASLWIKDDGTVRLDGDDDALYQDSGRGRGKGKADSQEPLKVQPKASPSKMVKRRKLSREDSTHSTKSQSSSSSGSSSGRSVDSSRYAEHPHNIRSALLLLDIFHAHTRFWLDGLQNILLVQSMRSQKQASASLSLTPQHLVSLRLSSLSEIDSRFVECLATTRFNRRAHVKRSWRDLMAAMMGW